MSKFTSISIQVEYSNRVARLAYIKISPIESGERVLF